MYTFLVGAGIGRDAEATLARARSATEDLMPRLGAEVASAYASFPTIDGGWYYYLPAAAPPKPLITAYRTPRQAVLVYGDIDDAAGVASPAEQVAITWQAQDLESVRRLTGSFSAVLIDLISGDLFIVSDAVGRRALRYFCEKDLLLISNHDLPIVSTGLCPLNFDLVSAASIVSYEWSIGGASLLQDIRVCDPHSYLSRHAGRTERVRQPILSLQGRLERRETRAQSQITDDMAETVRRACQVLCENQNEIHISLTGGLDSRAIFAALVSVCEPGRIVAHTSGSLDDVDVSTARRIAGAYGAQHKVSAPEAASSDAFVANCDVLAFYRNGDVCSKRAMYPLMRYDDDMPVWFGGQGGEIFRGYYYPRDSRGRVAMSLHGGDEATQFLLTSKLKRTSRLPWNDEGLPAAFLSRFTGILQAYQDISPNGFDVLDMFYLYERSARWSYAKSLPNLTNHCAPFENGALTAKAYQLPAPIGQYCFLQERLIRSWLKRAYWWPINGERIIPLDGIPGTKRLLRWRKIIGRAGFRLMGNELDRHSRVDQEVMRAELLAGPLAELMTDSLQAQGSFARAIFAREGLSKMIDAHRAGVKFELEVLGCLLTMERWRHQITEARRRGLNATFERQS